MIWYGKQKVYYGKTSDNRIVRVTGDCMTGFAIDTNEEENEGELANPDYWVNAISVYVLPEGDVTFVDAFPPDRDRPNHWREFQAVEEKAEREGFVASYDFDSELFTIRHKITDQYQWFPLSQEGAKEAHHWLDN